MFRSVRVHSSVYGRSGSGVAPTRTAVAAAPVLVVETTAPTAKSGGCGVVVVDEVVEGTPLRCPGGRTTTTGAVATTATSPSACRRGGTATSGGSLFSHNLVASPSSSSLSSLYLITTARRFYHHNPSAGSASSSTAHAASSRQPSPPSGSPESSSSPRSPSSSSQTAYRHRHHRHHDHYDRHRDQRTNARSSRGLVPTPAKTTMVKHNSNLDPLSSRPYDQSHGSRQQQQEEDDDHHDYRRQGRHQRQQHQHHHQHHQTPQEQPVQTPQHSQQQRRRYGLSALAFDKAVAQQVQHDTQRYLQKEQYTRIHSFLRGLRESTRAAVTWEGALLALADAAGSGTILTSRLIANAIEHCREAKQFAAASDLYYRVHHEYALSRGPEATLAFLRVCAETGRFEAAKRIVAFMVDSRLAASAASTAVAEVTDATKALPPPSTATATAANDEGRSSSRNSSVTTSTTASKEASVWEAMEAELFSKGSIEGGEGGEGEGEEEGNVISTRNSTRRVSTRRHDDDFEDDDKSSSSFLDDDDFLGPATTSGATPITNKTTTREATTLGASTTSAISTRKSASPTTTTPSPPQSSPLTVTSLHLTLLLTAARNISAKAQFAAQWQSSLRFYQTLRTDPRYRPVQRDIITDAPLVEALIALQAKAGHWRGAVTVLQRAMVAMGNTAGGRGGGSGSDLSRHLSARDGSSGDAFLEAVLQNEQGREVTGLGSRSGSSSNNGRTETVAGVAAAMGSTDDADLLSDGNFNAFTSSSSSSSSLEQLDSVLDSIRAKSEHSKRNHQQPTDEENDLDSALNGNATATTADVVPTAAVVARSSSVSSSSSSLVASSSSSSAPLLPIQHSAIQYIPAQCFDAVIHSCFAAKRHHEVVRTLQTALALGPASTDSYTPDEASARMALFSCEEVAATVYGERMLGTNMPELFDANAKLYLAYTQKMWRRVQEDERDREKNAAKTSVAAQDGQVVVYPKNQNSSQQNHNQHDAPHKGSGDICDVQHVSLTMQDLKDRAAAWSVACQLFLGLANNAFPLFPQTYESPFRTCIMAGKWEHAAKLILEMKRDQRPILPYLYEQVLCERAAHEHSPQLAERILKEAAVMYDPAARGGAASNGVRLLPRGQQQQGVLSASSSFDDAMMSGGHQNKRGGGPSPAQLAGSGGASTAVNRYLALMRQALVTQRPDLFQRYSKTMRNMDLPETKEKLVLTLQYRLANLFLPSTSPPRRNEIESSGSDNVKRFAAEGGDWIGALAAFSRICNTTIHEAERVERSSTFQSYSAVDLAFSPTALLRLEAAASFYVKQQRDHKQRWAKHQQQDQGKDTNAHKNEMGPTAATAATSSPTPNILPWSGEKEGNLLLADTALKDIRRLLYGSSGSSSGDDDTDRSDDAIHSSNDNNSSSHNQKHVALLSPPRSNQNQQEDGKTKTVEGHVSTSSSGPSRSHNDDDGESRATNPLWGIGLLRHPSTSTSANSNSNGRGGTRVQPNRFRKRRT